METVNLFGAQRGRAAQAAAWAMEKERFSTQEMANALAVSTPTAITLLRRLEGHGLVQPCGEFSSTGGRKPRAWSACPGARYVVGADITLRHVSLVAVDLSGQVTRTQTRTLAFTRTPAYFRALAAFISELCAELPRQSVLGVGLSIPGIIGSGQDLVLRSHALSIQGLRADEFEQYLGLPCRMINDANAGCLAEAWADVSLRDAVYLSLSNSVGSAVLIGRRLYLGHNLRSGEVGHTTLVPGGRPCYCGKSGCVDAYCRAGLLHGHTGGSLKDFFLRLHTDDAALRSVWDAYLDNVAVVVNNLRMMLDCDVILGGYVGRYMDAELAGLRRRAAFRNTFEPDANYLKACAYKKEAAALGSAIPWIEEYLQTL